MTKTDKRDKNNKKIKALIQKYGIKKNKNKQPIKTITHIKIKI